MKKNNLSALLITEPTNLFYYTGASYFGEMSFPRPAVLIIPRNGDSILVTHDFHLAIDWGGDIRRYNKVGEVPIEMVKSAFEDAGCTTGRVGAEFGREQRLGMSYQDFTKVQDALPAVSFVDAADMIWQLRMVKFDAEIAIITEACKIHDTILEPGMILHIEPGCIEKDGIYVLEHQVLVTETGCKVLSRTPCELQSAGPGR